MTNEQLAILIRNYALRLAELIEKLDENMPEGAEEHLEWIKLDGTPALGPFDVFCPELMDARITGKSDTLKQVPTGDYVCLDGLRRFLAELHKQIDHLNAAKKQTR